MIWVSILGDETHLICK